MEEMFEKELHVQKPCQRKMAREGGTKMTTRAALPQLAQPLLGAGRSAARTGKALQGALHMYLHMYVYKGQKIPNADLWRQLDELLEAREPQSVKMTKVR